MSDNMAGEIIKVYNTFENARAGGTTGQVTVGTVSSNGGAVYNSTLLVPFFLFKEYWYRIETTDPPQAVLIDWDDGEDNSPELSNVELIEPAKDVNYVITSHIYTRHGSFFPLIRVLGANGFYSKWYTNDANPGYTELEDLKFHTNSSNVTAGPQEYSVVRAEKSGTDKIPHFIPANRQPIAVLKADKRRIQAGIDNNLIAGTSPVLYAYTDSAALKADIASGSLTVTLTASSAESNQVREYASVPIHTATSVESANWTNDNLEDDTVPKGSVYSPATNEKTTITIPSADIADTTPSSENAGGWSRPTAGATPYILIYDSSNDSSKFNVFCTHPAVAQVTTLTFTGTTKSDYGGSLSASTGYIKLATPTGINLHWWFDTTGSQTVPSSITLETYKEEIDISGATTAADIAQLVKNAIDNGMPFTNHLNQPDSVNPFTAIVADNVVTVTTNSAGKVANVTTLNGLSNNPLSAPHTTVGEDAGSAPSGSLGTDISVTIASGDSAATIASAMATVLEARSEFTASAASNVITLERVTAGVTQNSTASGTPAYGLAIVDGTGSTGSVNNINKLYKAELSHINKLGTITGTTEHDRVYIMCHDFDGTTGDEDPQPTTDRCIAIISNGNPMTEWNDSYNTTVLDASESYPVASNVRIQDYSYDLDKRNVTGSIQYNVNAITTGSTSDSIDTGLVSHLTDIFGRTDAYAVTALNYANLDRIPVSYTFNHIGHPTDANYRFYNLQRLPRLQVEDNSLATSADASALTVSGDTIYGGQAGDIARYSNITSWNNDSNRNSGETNYMKLTAAQSFTKDATVTQANSGATGKVFRSTKDNKWLELYDVTGTFTTTASHTLSSSNAHDNDGSYPASQGMGTIRVLKEEYKTGRALMRVTNTSGRTNTASSRTSTSATAGETLSSTDTTFTVSDGGEFTAGDYIVGGTSATAEILKISSISTNDLTVTRGEFGTAPAEIANTTALYKLKANWMNTSQIFDTTDTILGGTGDFKLGAKTNNYDHAENFVCTVLPQKYDKLYFRVNNTLSDRATNPTITLSAYYTKRTIVSNIASYSWEPLQIEDNTTKLYGSGLIKWDIPEDWYNVIADDLTWDIVSEDGGASDIGTAWDKDGYGILIAINVVDTGTDRHKINITNVWPMIDEHTELITIEDPHHVSLNSISLAQSISYRRQGKYMIVEDRLGRADIRRIGAMGGVMSFGGIDLGSDKTGRDKIVSYQKEGTPVYIDVEHKDGDTTRFFGKITSVSEDFPTGKLSPKWALQMQVAYCIEYNSSGVMTSGKISLGGVVDNEPEYIL